MGVNSMPMAHSIGIESVLRHDAPIQLASCTTSNSAAKGA